MCLRTAATSRHPRAGKVFQYAVAHVCRLPVMPGHKVWLSRLTIQGPAHVPVRFLYFAVSAATRRSDHAPSKPGQILTASDTVSVQSCRYAEHGIPYRRGYLLFGPPGTGKTSLVSPRPALSQVFGFRV